MRKFLLLSALIILMAPGLKAQTFSANISNATCNGMCNGAAQILPPGNYHYHWINGDTTAWATNLCPGQYWCIISDSNYHVFDSVLVSMMQTPPMTITVSVTAANCGVSNGTVAAIVSGGTPPYTFNWSNGETGPFPMDLSAGVYMLTVIDAHGCDALAAATVPGDATSILIQDSLTVASACGACNGLVYTTVQGGAPPYSYLWNSTDTRITPPLCAGVNTLVVTDANSCTATQQFIVNNAGNLTASVTNTNISCPHPVDTTTVTVTGGSQRLSFFWGDNTAPDTGVTAPRTHTYSTFGVYIIQVSDSAGCSWFFSDSVQNHGIALSVSQLTNAVCTNINGGSVFVSATGGTGPYTYVWNNAGITDTIANLAAGNYAVTATDNTGCSSSTTYTLQQINAEPGYYAYEQTASVNCNAANGSVIAYVYGGVPPYSYLWSNAGGRTTDTLTGLSAGSYNVTVTDSVGCQALGYGSVSSTCYNVITGNVFYDANGNCIPDSGETTLPAVITAVNGINTYYANSYNNGQYVILIPASGTYTLSLSLSGCGAATLCGNTQYTVTFTGLGDTSVNNNFAVIATTNNFDLTLHPGWTPANPGFTKEYWVMGYNQSSLPFNGTATITFNYDSNLIYQYSDTPLPVHNAAAHTLTWQVTNLPSPGFDWNGRFRNFFTVPATLSASYLLQSKFTITPTVGDCDSSNNTFVYSEPCGGSHDPNYKEVSPAGVLTETDSVLTYTISFQNTGTAATNFIIVTDTLSSNLDPATVVNVAGSAKYSDFSISGAGILTWTFNPLFLPDSLSDVNGSKGFIIFTVKKKSNLLPGANISNRASIHFDYNTPVVTNTVTDTVATPNFIFEVRNNTAVDVKAFPNPFSDITNIVVSGLNTNFGFELYDVTGRLQQVIPSIGSNQFQIHRNRLAGGVYLYRIIVSNSQVAYGKLVVE